MYDYQKRKFCKEDIGIAIENIMDDPDAVGADILKDPYQREACYKILRRRVLMAKTEWEKYRDLYYRLQKDCRAWDIVEVMTGRSVGSIIMRFTPNHYGQFGRGGLRLYVYADPNNTSVKTEALIATATAGGCGYDKVRHMIDAMLHQLKDPIKKHWDVDISDGDISNNYEDIFRLMGLTLYEVI